MAGEQIGVGPLRLERLARASAGAMNQEGDVDLANAPKGLVLVDETRSFVHVQHLGTPSSDRDVTWPDETLILGAKTVEIPVDSSAFNGLAAVWSVGIVGGQNYLRRVASANNTDMAIAPITQEVQQTFSKGYEVTKIRAVWNITVAALTNVSVSLLSSRFEAHGVAPSAAGLGGSGIGQLNADYDTNNDTPAKRAALGYHTADIIPSGGALGFMSINSTYKIRLDVDGSGGATGVLDFFGVILTITRAND